jgi:peptide deformylase
MSRLMYEGMGIGLAAPQVGIDEQMIVVDIGSGLYKLINPRIIKRQGRQSLSEGCLSIPGVCINVRRANKVLVRALDEEGKKQEIEAEDLLACVLQHEIDHLKGKIIIDYASFIEKIRIKKAIEELKRQAKGKKSSGKDALVCQLEL